MTFFRQLILHLKRGMKGEDTLHIGNKQVLLKESTQFYPTPKMHFDPVGSGDLLMLEKLCVAGFSVIYSCLFSRLSLDVMV